jgi:hypothetical protein
MVRVPLLVKTSLNAGVNLLSRSRIRNLKWPARSPGSMSKLGPAGRSTLRHGSGIHPCQHRSGRLQDC